MNLEVTEIGDQIWMAKNLNVSHFRNGNPVPEIRANEDWIEYAEEGKPAWCYYDNDPANEEKYGKLYNWYAVIDARGLAPKGWHIPSDDEWARLIDYLGGFTLAGEKLKPCIKEAKSLKTLYESGFNALPAGYRNSKGGFSYLGNCGFWWSSTGKIPDNAWCRYMYFNDNDVNRGSFNRRSGFSVRCLQAKLTIRY